MECLVLLPKTWSNKAPNDKGLKSTQDMFLFGNHSSGKAVACGENNLVSVLSYGATKHLTTWASSPYKVDQYLKTLYRGRA